MLSKDAWNALLKTLEEPPAHVIFILATTELNKVPDTIISRCQTFVFHRPGRELIRKFVVNIAKKEGFNLDHGAADLIALLGDGSFRDSLGILEKIIATASNKNITRKDAENITGAPKAELVQSYISNVLNKNADEALKTIGQADKNGLSMNIFMTLILEKLRFILLIQHSPSSAIEVKERLSADDWVYIEEQAQKKVLTTSTLLKLLEAANQIERAKIQSLPLELVTVEVCTK